MTETTAQGGYRGSTREAGSPCYRCQGQKSPDGQLPVKIRVAVFFDGTLNNRTNTGLGEKGVHRGVSYENALTNIAILERYFSADPQYHHSFSIYVEGIGTEDEKSDSMITAGTGQGGTGIHHKVAKGVSLVIDKIKKRLKTKQRIECLHIDCFGFSRGAAAARNFIHSALYTKKKTVKSLLEQSGYCVSEIKIKFVGLYDTVASHGLNHENDTAKLHLDAIRHSEFVIQVAAAEEHRINFPLTNINSAPHGVQLFLPGAHSDIGGGYPDKMDEVGHKVMSLFRTTELRSAEKAVLTREREWLIASGWYHENEIHDADIWDEIKVTRRMISNSYHRIPLKLMAEFAAEKGICFKPALIKDYAIPSFLRGVEALIRKSPLSSPEHWLRSRTDDIRKLRHDYLHFSACFGSPMRCNEPRFVGYGITTQRRKREVLDG